MSFSEILAFTPGSFHAPWEKSLHSTSFESSNKWFKILGWTEVWQYSKLVKYPLENQYFASYIAIAAVYFERICILIKWFQVMLIIFIIYGSLILMNLIVALMITETNVSKSEVSLIKQRVDEIKDKTDIITRHVTR